MNSAAAVERSLRSLGDIDSIVGAMKAYAGVAFRRADEVVANVRACEENVTQALGELVGRHPHLLPGTIGGAGKRVLVAFGSSLGLCGMFNEKVLEEVARLSTGGDALFTVGRRLNQLAEARHLDCSGQLEAPASVEGINWALRECLVRVRETYAREEYFDLSVVFTTVAGNRATIAVQRVLPAEPCGRAGAGREAASLVIYEEPEQLFAGLLQELLSICLYRCYIESLRSENWYRLRAMEGASESLKRKKGELRSLYHYLRQEEVTEEVLEILGGGMFFG